MADCPSCGRYVGPYPACPYCGAAQAGRTPLRWIKIGALVLALGGLALLWLVATRSAVPLVEIGQVNSTMNMAYVRVEGLVNRSPSYDPESDYLSFWLADDTGEVRVSVYRQETRKLLAAGRVPALGDKVSVQGTLRVREDSVGLTLNVPDKLKISRPEPQERQIASISAQDEFARLALRGQVRAIRTPYEGLTLLGLRDESGQIEIAIYEDLTALGGDLPTLTTGQSLAVVGTVSLYQDSPQLNLTNASDVTILPEPLIIAPQTAIGQLNTAQVGAWLMLEGRVTDAAPFSAGVKYTLDDGTGQITLLLWDSLYQALPLWDSAIPDAEALLGASLQIRGELAAYRGELEILPELIEDITLVAQADDVPLATVEAARVSQLTADDIGRFVQLSGALGPPQTFSKGVKWLLDDGSGEITLLLWQDVYDALTDAESLTDGAQVRVTGKIEEYQGDLQVVPAAASALQIIETPTAQAAATPTPVQTGGPPVSPAPPTPTPSNPITLTLGQVSADMSGQTLTLSGTLAAVESFGRGFKFTLDDDSGQIVLLTWLDVYDKIRGRAGLNVGASVQVYGAISDFEGELQITPQGAGDVLIISPGAGRQAPLRDVVSLTLDDVGSWLAVQGQVVRSEAFSDGMRIYLDDGSGEIMVLLWQNILERVPADVALTTIGSRLRVVGQVQAYQGALEIIPALPFDIEPVE